MEKEAAKSYDVVVIGAGNGGLTAAIRVLQGGRSCLLLEKHNLPAGLPPVSKEAGLNLRPACTSSTTSARRRNRGTSAPCSRAWG